MSNYSLIETNVIADARREVKKGNTAAAIALYQRVVTNNPGNRKARKELAALQKKVGSDGSREQRQTDLKQLVTLYQTARIDAARKEAHRLIALYPRQPLPHSILGAIYSDAGNNEEAVKCYQRAVLIDPDYTAALSNLGTVLSNLDRLQEAKACFEQAMGKDPKLPVLASNLGNVLIQLGRPEEAVGHLIRATVLEPRHIGNYLKLGQAYADAGKTDKARQSYERALAVEPHSTAVQHRLDALIGNTTGSAPSDYITEIFDEAAVSFEKKLVNRLQYSAPEYLRGMLDKLTADSSRSFTRTIDLGCGTGLSGAAFSDISGHLTGVDLSPKMLDQARNREIYDSLVLGDLVSSLAGTTHGFDLFICADVLIYVGDPNPLFGAITQRSNAGALFLLTTEHATSGNFHLLPTERYAHSRSCIEEAAGCHGMTPALFETTTLRLERGEELTGGMYVFRLP